MSNQLKPRRGPKFLTVLLAAVLAVSAVVDGFCFYDLMGRKVETTSVTASEEEGGEGEVDTSKLAAERKDDEQSHSDLIKKGMTMTVDLLSKLKGKKVDSRYDAVNAVKDVSSELGIEDPDQHIESLDTFERGGKLYHLLKQVFNSIEVLGGGLVVTADAETHEILDITGKYIKIPENISIDPVISSDKAETIAADYVKSKVPDPEAIRTSNQGTKIVPLSQDNTILGYQVRATDTNTGKAIADVIVDAQTGDVAATKTLTNNTVRIDSNNKNQGRTNNFDTDPDSLGLPDPDEGVYEVRDGERRINLYTETEETADLNNLDGKRVTVDTNDENADKAPFDLINSVQKTYDLFDSCFGYKGINGSEGSITVYYGGDDAQVFTGDATKTVDLTDTAVYCGDSTLFVGKASAPDSGKSVPIDEVARVYTLGIEEELTSLFDGYVEFGTTPDKTTGYVIAEGIADIFGEIAEDKADGKFDNSCDWTNASGSLKPNGQADYNNYEPGKTDYETAKHFITDPAYYMSQTIDNETIAHLYFDILPQLNYNTDLPTLRKIIESEAAEMNAAQNNGGSQPQGRVLTDDQFEAVIDAFDRTGIPSGFEKSVAAGGKITVIDDDNKESSSYKITLARIKAPDVPVFETEVTTDGFKLPATVHNGIYVLTVSDVKDVLQKKSYTVIINDNAADQKVTAYPDELRIFTHIGAKSRDVVLVLDVSGSMYGTPMEQTIQSGVKFVESVLEQSPSTRISVVPYSDGIESKVEASSDRDLLTSAIRKLSSGGGTATYAGLDSAREILENSRSEKRLVVLMSDGAPNVGPTGDDGKYETAIVELANKMKKDGLMIYTLGFFHNLYGSDRDICQKLMHDIATEGYDYVVDSAEQVNFDVEDPDSELYKVFNDFADMVNGKKYINIRIACPVDVTVTYNGETLTSAKKGKNTRTSFGTLSIEENSDEDSEDGKSNDTVKTLRLEEGVDYEVCINGTGKGKMDYTISYPDENGDYTDVREFKNVPITKDTVIVTSTKQEKNVGLEVDTDGDGNFDLAYEAGENKDGKKTSKTDTMFIILLISNILVGGIVLLYVVLAIRRRSAAKKLSKAQTAQAQAQVQTVCPQCGAPYTGDEKFCRGCGTPRAAAPVQPVAQVQLVQEAPKVKKSKAPVIIKLSVIAVCAGFTFAVVSLYNSSATSVFRQLRKNQTNSAAMLYDKSVKGSGIKDSYLSFLTNHHMKKVNEAYADGKYSEEEYRTLLEGVAALKLEGASDNAKDYLKDLKKSSKDTDKKVTDKKDSSDKSSDKEDE